MASVFLHTPVHRGNTPAFCRTWRPSCSYPCAQGEHRGGGGPLDLPFFIPLRTGGTRRGFQPMIDFMHTPAHRGNTASSTIERDRPVSYPCAQGEHKLVQADIWLGYFIPLRTGGTPDRVAIQEAHDLHTPAHRGNTTARVRASDVTCSYPCAQGEHRYPSPPACRAFFIPQRTGGTPENQHSTATSLFHTPAHRGNTDIAGFLKNGLTSYPCAQGEHRGHDQRAVYVIFIPLRTGGTPLERRGARHPDLHTPAHRGNTLTRSI